MGKNNSGSGSSWLMTYADFITLMMIFFIVVYTLTPGIERVRFEEFIAPFQGKRSIIELPEQGGFQDSPEIKTDLSAFEQFLLIVEEMDAQDEISVEYEDEFIRITLQEPVTFDTYSSILLYRSMNILAEIAKVIQSFEDSIERVYINGHTDNVPIRANAPLYQSNWELGGARALSVLTFLSESGNLPSSLFIPSSFAEYNSVASNETAEGRAKNRRVEMLLFFDDISSSINHLN